MAQGLLAEPLNHTLRRCVVMACLTFFGSCGGGSSSTPTSATPVAPPVAVAPTATALSISPSADLVLLGQFVTFSATARYSDGSSRAIAASWESSNPDVVSVGSLADGTGRATAQRAGIASVTARAVGLSAATTVRGLPDFSGNWTAQVRATVCTAPARWGSSFCGNKSSSLTNELIQLQRSAGDGVVGSIIYTSWNGNVWSGSVAGTVAVDGSLSLLGRLNSPRPQVNFNYFSDLTQWSTRLSPTLGLSGSYSEIVTLVGEPDKAFLTYEIVRATK